MDVPLFGPAGLAQELEFDVDANMPRDATLTAVLIDGSGQTLAVAMSVDAMRQILDGLLVLKDQYPGIFRLD